MLFRTKSLERAEELRDAALLLVDAKDIGCGAYVATQGKNFFVIVRLKTAEKFARWYKWAKESSSGGQKFR